MNKYIWHQNPGWLGVWEPGGVINFQKRGECLELKSNMISSTCSRDQRYMYQSTYGKQLELQWGKYKGLSRKRGKTGQLASASDKQKRKHQNFNGWVEDGLVFFSAVLFPSTELLNNWIKGAL